MRLVECKVLAPLYRGDRGDVSAADWDWLESELVQLAGGWTCHPVRGCWRDQRGRCQEDVSQCYLVAIHEGAEQRLLDLAGQLASRFGQDCVYVSVGTTAYLVPSPEAQARRAALDGLALGRV